MLEVSLASTGDNSFSIAIVQMHMKSAMSAIIQNNSPSIFLGYFAIIILNNPAQAIRTKVAHNAWTEQHMV